MIAYEGTVCHSSDEACRRLVEAGQNYVRAKEAYKQNHENPAIIAELAKARVHLENAEAVVKEWIALPKTDDASMTVPSRAEGADGRARRLRAPLFPRWTRRGLSWE